MMTLEERNKIVLESTNLVGHLACNDDQFQEGVIGLIKSTAHFNVACGGIPQSYIYHNIRGSILDSLRKWRGCRDATKRIKWVSLDDCPGLYLTVPNNIIDELDRKQLLEIVRSKIDELKSKTKRVLVLYYFKRKTLKEIGVIMKITESRVHQIKSAGMIKLRRKLRYLVEERRGIPT